MSAAHRAGNGGGGYYPGGEVLARQRQGEAAAGWGAGYYPSDTGRSWPGGGEMGGASGAQNSPYPGYEPNSWSCAGHQQPPYPPSYPVGGQGMEHYANGSYGPAYGQSAMNQSYPGMPPPNPYYSPPPPPPPSQPHYTVDPYKQQSGPPQAPPHWGYPQQHPQYPQYQAPPAMPQQSPQNENWNVYGAPNPYQWPTAPPPPPQHNPSSGHYMAAGGAPWQGGDVQQGVYDVKEVPPQPPNYNNQRPFPGYQPGISQPGQPSEPKPNPVPPNPHYSASPQMYNRRDPSNEETIPRTKEANASPADPANAHPSIVKITQVLEKVAELEEEVDEFVGRKTDMSYRCLEELLTKQLLELDSIETGGLDNVRQARKEAVRKLQSILERLERKGL
ncbi:BAG family molecular chaperone regulator 4 isoform X1 [Hyperolius riggenbachi]|uniref:BAG family molecular chaperone regulator 4 isoform X1 n=1 Tax=Hyperolius riggenbachi TaxID=752182 RepID=UPI0035A36B50